MRVLARFPAILVALACSAPAAEAPPGWEAALAAGQPVSVTADPVEVGTGRLTGLALRGAWELNADRDGFGGLSGLVIRDRQLYAVADNGSWFGAELLDGGDGGLTLTGTRMAPMRDQWGQTYDRIGGDAEGLAWDGERLAVSFERDHRIMRLGDSGRMEATIAPRRFERLQSNRGLEALASLPSGGLIALAEGRDDKLVPVFLIAPDGTDRETSLPLAWLHQVTGADVGPDGRLYLVLREFSLLFGVSIRIVRFDLGPDGAPRPGSIRTLAAFENASGIDNMEGLAVEALADGSVRLWLISDDNFNPLQRTLLLSFDVLP